MPPPTQADRNRRKILIGSTVAVALFAILLAVMPYITVWRMTGALEARDSEKLAAFVDFPAVRENLKSSLAAGMVEQASKSGKAPDAGIGLAMAAMVIGPLVDAMITPEGMTKIFAGLPPSTGKKSAAAKTSSVSPAQDAPGQDSKVDRSMAYESMDHFVVTIHGDKSRRDREGTEIGLVFRRAGIFSWKLTALRLPLPN